MSDQIDGWSDIPGSQSANNTIYLKLPVYTMVYNAPTWFVNLLATGEGTNTGLDYWNGLLDWHIFGFYTFFGW